MGHESCKGSSLLSSLQPTWSLMGRGLTLVLVGSVLLEKMAGSEWPVMWHQTPNSLSDSKRVTWVSHARVTPKHLRYPSGSQSRSQDCSQTPWLYQSCGHKGGAEPGAPWPAQRLLAQVQRESPDGGDGRLSAPLLVYPCPGSGSAPGWGM